MSPIIFSNLIPILFSKLSSWNVTNIKIYVVQKDKYSIYSKKINLSNKLNKNIYNIHLFKKKNPNISMFYLKLVLSLWNH